MLAPYTVAAADVAFLAGRCIWKDRRRPWRRRASSLHPPAWRDQQCA